MTEREEEIASYKADIAMHESARDEHIWGANQAMQDIDELKAELARIEK